MNELVDDILAVSAAAFDPHYREAWNRAQLETALVTPNTHCLRATKDGSIVDERAVTDPDTCTGFLLSRAAPGEEELLLIAVDPEVRRQGTGSALLQRFLESARARGAEAVFLEMRENNPAAAFYCRLGFVSIGRRRDYYRLADGSRLDAITFRRSLLEQ